MMSLKVTVTVETSEGYGKSDKFTAELPGPASLELSGHAPIYAEQLIAEVGAHLVRKVAAVYGDHRDDEVRAAKLPRLRRLRPLSDFDEAREAARRGVLAPQFPVNRDLGVEVAAGLATLREQTERAMNDFVESLAIAKRNMERRKAEANDGKSTAG